MSTELNLVDLGAVEVDTTSAVATGKFEIVVDHGSLLSEEAEG